MIQARRWLSGVALAGVVLTACGGADDSPEEPSDAGAPSASEPAGEQPAQDRQTTGEPSTGDDTASAFAAEIEAAVTDAAAAFDVASDDIEVVRSEAVTWPDGSLGCPRSGEMYTQALVEGYRIVLSVRGDRVHYHGRSGDEPFRCDDPEEPAG